MDRWIELTNKIGFNNARIVAHAVAWCFRYDNWRFLAWYTKLNPNLQEYINQYFDEYLNYELKERSITHSIDLSLLSNYFNLPIVEKIHKGSFTLSKAAYVEKLKKEGIYKPKKKMKRKRR